MTRAQTLPNQPLDGDSLKLAPTEPTKKFMRWYEAHGAAAAAADTGGAEGTGEDGEAPAGDMGARESDALEQITDLVMSRGDGGGGGDRARGAERSGHRGADGHDVVDRLIDRAERPGCASVPRARPA